MKIMAEQFVIGETIDGAIERAAPREALGYRYSYDMLGEAARTERDAERYFAAYERGDRRDRARGAMVRRAMRGPAAASRSSSRRCIRATRRRSAERVFGELVPRI